MVSRSKTRLVAFLSAALMASALSVLSSGWTPLCVIYTPDDAMYWILGCWIDPPPKDPTGG